MEVEEGGYLVVEVLRQYVAEGFEDAAEFCGGEMLRVGIEHVGPVDFEAGFEGVVLRDVGFHEPGFGGELLEEGEHC